jgi:hypothetical protein
VLHQHHLHQLAHGDRVVNHQDSLHVTSLEQWRTLRAPASRRRRAAPGAAACPSGCFLYHARGGSGNVAAADRSESLLTVPPLCYLAD